MALLIDPKAKTITHVVFDGTLEQAYRFTECDHVTEFKLDAGMGTLILDEEGMLKSHLEAFMIMRRVFTGKTLVVGMRGWKGEPKMDLALALHLVRFEQ